MSFPPRRGVFPDSPCLLARPALHAIVRRLLPLRRSQFGKICFLLLHSQSASTLAYITCNAVWWSRCVFFFMENIVDDDNACDFGHKEKKTRTQRYIYARRDMEDDPLEIIPPQESLRYCLYVRNFYIYEDEKLQKAFRQQFCLTYTQYLELLDLVASNDLFDRWCGYRKNNKKVSPVELLVLGSLCYLGRGWTFDDCEESNAIDKEIHCCFFNVFIQFGSTVLYKKWVLTPANLPEAKLNMYKYTQAGFPGCIDTSDCTHIVTDRCRCGARQCGSKCYPA